MLLSKQSWKNMSDALSIDETDGVSLAFDNWRSIGKSNNEPLVRLNIEARGNAIDINEKLEEIKSLIKKGSTRSPFQ